MTLFGNKKRVLPTTWLRLLATTSALVGLPNCTVYDPLESTYPSPDGATESGRPAPRDGAADGATDAATRPSEGSTVGAEPAPDLDAHGEPEAERAPSGPDATSPDAVTDAVAPDGRASDAAADVSAPDAATGEVSSPDTASPDAMGQDVSTPDASTADAAAPDEAAPEPTPDVGAPDAAAPDAAAPDAEPPRDASLDRSDGACGSPAIATDGCVELAPLAAPPVIDGNLECGVVLRALTAVGWSGGATPNDTTASYAVRWRPDGIYFYVLVEDPALVPAEPTALAWMGDAVEIYLDSDAVFTPPNYDNPGARQLIIASPSSTAPTVARAEAFSFGNVGFPQTWSSSEFGAYTKPGGYAVEGFVRAADLGLAAWSLAAGQSVGLDLSIDVSFANATTVGVEGHRAGQYFLHLDPTLGSTPPYSNPNAFCRPLLLP